jgi:hypothetical protein
VKKEVREVKSVRHDKAERVYAKAIADLEAEREAYLDAHRCALPANVRHITRAEVIEGAIKGNAGKRNYSYRPAACYLCVDVRDGRVWAEFQWDHAYEHEHLERKRLVQTFRIQPMLAQDINDLMDEIVPLAERIVAGTAVIFEDDDWVGYLNEDAQQAKFELYSRCNEEIATLDWITVSEWYDGVDARLYDVTPENAEDLIAEIEEEIDPYIFDGSSSDRPMLFGDVAEYVWRIAEQNAAFYGED